MASGGDSGAPLCAAAAIMDETLIGRSVLEQAARNCRLLMGMETGASESTAVAQKMSLLLRLSVHVSQAIEAGKYSIACLTCAQQCHLVLRGVCPD